MSRRALLAVVVVVVAALMTRPGAAQQADPPPFRPVPGRYLPAPLGGHLAVLDAYTGRVHFAPEGEAIAGDAWVIDVEAAQRWRRPLSRDVSSGQVLQHGLPLAGTGAGSAVFAWQPAGDTPGVLDTRTGAHYLILGDVAGDCRIVRTDLRLLTRSVRQVPAAGHSGGSGE
jgi:hypothetical protein